MLDFYTHTIHIKRGSTQMKFPKPRTHTSKKGANLDTKSYTTRIDTTVSVENLQKYREWNFKNPSKKITWAEAIRRGFSSLLREKEGMSLIDLSDNADYIPIAVRERVRQLSQKIQELSLQVGCFEDKNKKRDISTNTYTTTEVLKSND